MQYCGHYDLFQPFDEDAQEAFYVTCKIMCSLKISVVFAVKRKWTYEVDVFPMWASHATAWKEQQFSQLISIECRVWG